MKNLTRAINDHLSSEFQASHACLAISNWLRENDLINFSSYLSNKSNEERAHAYRMIAYLVDRDQQVELPTVDALERQWPSVMELFDIVAQMGKKVTASIDHLYMLA